MPRGFCSESENPPEKYADPAALSTDDRLTFCQYAARKRHRLNIAGGLVNAEFAFGIQHSSFVIDARALVTEIAY